MNNIMLSNNLQWVIIYNSQGYLLYEFILVKRQQYYIKAVLSDLTW
jgi:hypothetical protein